MKKLHSFAAALAALLVLAGCHDTPLTSPDPEVGDLVATPFRTGFIEVEGDIWEVEYEIRNGRGIFEGDIDIGPADEIPRTRAELIGRSGDGPRLGIVHNSSSRRWSNGVVPYVIESTVGNPHVHSAMAHIQNSAAGLTFVPRTNQSSYIIFRRTTDPDICGQSQVGRVGGGQYVELRDNASFRCVVHEVGHALGSWHEQSRCDRDSFVQILSDSIQSGRASQFNKRCGFFGSDGIDVGGYDEYSIMHYHKNAFGIVINGRQAQTIRSLRGLDAVLGTGTSLSIGDVHAINWMYTPYGPANVSVTHSGGDAVISWSASTGATHYTVVQIDSYEYYNNWTGESSITEYRGFTASTTGTSMAYGAYTGNTICVTYDSMYETHQITYWYELRAHFPNGIHGAITRWPAPIGNC